MRRLVAPVCLALAACGGTEPPAQTTSEFIDGFTPNALTEGFTRFVTPAIAEIAPGKDETYCQWLSDPATDDVDIMDAEGAQSMGGHHVVLYATTLRSPIGTSRPCTDADQVSLRYLGAIGGEGVSGAVGKLPKDVVYRLPKGWALMGNVHYVNYTTKPMAAQSVIDVKMGPANPNASVASLFVNTVVDELEIPPGEHTITTSCEIQQDLPVVLAANHMHERGTKVKSVIKRVAGGEEVIRDDTIWAPESVFAPQMVRYPDGQPNIFKTGDTLQTTCTWNNQEGKTLGFPSEMCVTFAFYLGSGLQITCVGGHWE